MKYFIFSFSRFIWIFPEITFIPLTVKTFTGAEEARGKRGGRFWSGELSKFSFFVFPRISYFIYRIFRIIV